MLRLDAGVLGVVLFDAGVLGLDIVEVGVLGFGVRFALMISFPLPFTSMITSSSDPSNVVDRRWREGPSSDGCNEGCLRLVRNRNLRNSGHGRTCLFERDLSPWTLSCACYHAVSVPSLLAPPGVSQKRPLLSV